MQDEAVVMAAEGTHEIQYCKKEKTDNDSYVKLSANVYFTQIYFAPLLLSKMIPTLLCAYGMFSSV